MTRYKLFYVVVPEPPEIISTAAVGKAEYARLSLDFGSEQIHQQFRTEFGDDFNEAWTRDGLPTISVETDAADIPQAIVETYPDAKALVDSMSILELKKSTGIDASPEKALDLSTRMLVTDSNRDIEIEIIKFYVGGLVRVNLGEEKRKDEKVDELLLPLLRQLWDFLTDPYLVGTQAVARVRRFFRWYSSSRRAQSVVEKFIAAWLSLETLVGCEEDKGKKGSALKQRLSALTSLHMPDSDWKPVIDRLWKLRGEIMHEAAVAGMGDRPKGSVTLASEVSYSRYLALISAEFLAHSTQPEDTLFNTWSSRLKDYRPRILLRFDELPSMHGMPILVSRAVIDNGSGQTA